MLYRTEDLARWGAGKGANLLPVEIDENNWEVEGRLQAVEAAAGEAANGIQSISVTGSQMTVYLEDGTALGPYTLPTAMIRYRGDWTTSTAYGEMDLVTVPDAGIYLVLQDHTSDAGAFDALADDGEGNPLYRFLFPMGESGAGALGDLSDVDLASEAPADGQALVFFGGTWFPGRPTMALSDLAQVFPGTPSDGDALTWVAADAAWRSRKSRPSVSDEGSAVVASPTDLNFAGAGVSVADDGDGTVTITVPGGGSAAAVSDEGSEVLASPTDINFAGAGVSVADDGDGTVTVTIPGGGSTSVSDEGTQVLAGPSDINFVGPLVAVSDDGDGTVTVSFAGAAMLADENVFTSQLSFFQWSDDTGAAGPYVVVDRDSASPAAADSLGAFSFRGRNSLGAEIEYGVLYSVLWDPASGAETGQMYLQTMTAGSPTVEVAIGGGFSLGSATGGVQGVGTLNATALYLNGRKVPSGVAEDVAGTAYTALAADAGKWKRTTDASPVTITIDASVHAIHDEITFEQGGTGQITFAAGAGMTLNARGGALKSAGQYAVCGIKFISATEATLFGDITT